MTRSNTAWEWRIGKHAEKTDDGGRRQAKLAHQGTKANIRARGLLVFASTLILAMAGKASAANIDLTASVATPNGATLMPLTYAITFGNATTPPAAASSPTISLPLPANLYNVRIVSVTPLGGAVCPAPASFSGVPTGLTTGSQTMTATIASLPSAGFCTVTVQATPLLAQTYSLHATIVPGAGDTQINPGSASSVGNAAVSLSSANLSVQKAVLSPSAIAPGASGTEPYGSAVTYQLTYTNNSGLTLPVGLAGDQFVDNENSTSQAPPSGITTTIVGCTATGGTLCPAVTSTNLTSTNGNPLHVDTSQVVFQPHSQIVITYTRTYPSVPCGSPIVSNTDQWLLSSPYVNPTWSTTGAYVAIGFTPAAPACAQVAIAPSLSKTLDSISDASGSTKTTAAPFQITADGDTAHYTIKLTGDPSNWVSFFWYDALQDVLGGAQPTFTPAASVLQTVTIDSCTISGPGSGSLCPNTVPAYPFTVAANSPTYPTTFGGEVLVAAGQTMTIGVSLKYAINGAVCSDILDGMVNKTSVAANNPPAGSVYTGGTFLLADTSATPLSILPNLPRCVDIAANKQITPPNPLAGQPITFMLDYTNNTSKTTNNPYNAPDPVSNVAITDALGPNFTPTSVSCTTLSGTATAPAASVANVTGANHTFSATIPSISDGAVVRCIVSGTSTLPGTYSNSTTATPDAATGNVNAFNDATSTVGYGVVGPQVG